MDLLEISRTALFIVTGTRFRWLWIGLVAFSFVSLLGHFVEKREAAKKTFVSRMTEGMAEMREARFVGTFYTTDWISPFTQKPNVIFAVPWGSVDGAKKSSANEVFFLSIISYGEKKQRQNAVTADCKARTQEFSFWEGPSILVAEASDSDDRKYPRWIPAFCGNWSSEKQALREKEEKERRRKN